jgi:hypothetical protein
MSVCSSKRGWRRASGGCCALGSFWVLKSVLPPVRQRTISYRLRSTSSFRCRLMGGSRHRHQSLCGVLADLTQTAESDLILDCREKRLPPFAMSNPSAKRSSVLFCKNATGGNSTRQLSCRNSVRCDGGSAQINHSCCLHHFPDNRVQFSYGTPNSPLVAFIIYGAGVKTGKFTRQPSALFSSLIDETYGSFLICRCHGGLQSDGDQRRRQ